MPSLPPSQEIITVRYNVSHVIRNVSDSAYFADEEDCSNTLRKTVATASGLNDPSLISIFYLEPLVLAAADTTTAANYDNIFIYEVSFTLGQGNSFASASEGYNITTSNLNTSVIIGVFTKSLRNNAVALNGAAFVGAISDIAPRFTSFQTDAIPAPAPAPSSSSSDDGISDGATAAAVLFPLIVVLGGGGYYYYHYHHTKAASSSAGNDQVTKTDVFAAPSNTLKRDLLTLDEKQMSSSL
jgi:hypothetical protein